MGIETIIASLFKETLDEYIPIETASDTSLVFRGGQLASILQIHGVNNILSGDEMGGMLEDMASNMRGYMDGGGHQLQFCFIYDPDSTDIELEKILGPTRSVCKKIGIDDAIVVDDQIKRLKGSSSHEAVYLVLYTDFTGLSDSESKQHIKRVKKHATATPNMPNSQNMFVESTAISDKHTSFVDAIASDLENLGVRTSLYNAKDAVREIRRTMEPDLTDDAWSPYMPGDNIPLRIFNNGSCMGIPRISEQLLTRRPEIKGSDVEIGPLVFRPMLMTLPPKPGNIKLFSELFVRVPFNLPWRMSMHLKGDVMSGAGLKSFFATVLKVFSDTNRRIEKGYEHLKYVLQENADSVVGLRLGFMTWAPKNKPDLLDTRFSLLTRAIEGWGECKVTADIGDPFETFTAMSPGLSMDNLKSSMPAAPISDLVPMFPIFRPSVPWDYGFMTYTSLDGKMLPMEMASSEQANWNTIIFAPPGSGKSVIMLNMVLGLIFKAGNSQLPKIGIIDIGPTSRGLINFLKEVLPPHLKDKVGRFRMQFTDEYSINPMDTMLGKREPLPLDREFLVNLISILATPSGRETPYTGTSEVVGAALDVAYKEMGYENPNRYEPGEDPHLDDLIESLRMPTDSETSWWEVVDFLFEKGRLNDASIAQRFAVPLMSDISRIIEQDAGIRDLYRNDTVPGESVKTLEALARNIQAAIREFGIFSKPTMFSVDDMRVTALDLDEVAKGGSKKASVMYMIARYVLGRTFYFDEDYISLFPSQYHEHYERFFIENKGMSKGMFIDELHRTRPMSGADVSSLFVRNQIKVDQREGRKFGVQIVLASQEFVDFDDEMIDLSTTRMILGYGSRKEAREVCEHLGLPDGALQVLLRYVHAPGPNGANLIMNYKTKKGEFTQALNFKVSSQRLWALSTTIEDDIIMRMMKKEFSIKDSLRLLSEKFPGGSAKPEIEASLKMSEDDVDITSEDSEIAAQAFAKKLIKEFKKKVVSK